MNVSRRQTFILMAILLAAAGTRLIGLHQAPPGIHHDEASNGYDGYSLLKTGSDRWGHSWPVLLEGFGRQDYRGALYAYLTIPFHALWGPELLTVSTRLPAAVIGLLTIAALFLLVRRMENTGTALWAALFLTLSPWHLQLSRFGHEASLTPAFAVAALLLLSYALREDSQPGGGIGGRRLRLWPLVGAGVVGALSVYSYPSMKVFMPALAVAAIVCYRRVIRDAWRRPGDRSVILAMLACAAIVAAPMVWLTVMRWHEVNARAEHVFLFRGTASFWQAAKQTVGQYLAHFGPSWLLFYGDGYIIQSPPRGFGQINLAVFPLLLIGIYILFRRRRPIDWLLFAWLALYPIAAAPAEGGPHALRSACGLPVFQWTAAIGCQTVVTWAGRRWRKAALAAGVCGLAVGVNGAGLTYRYFFDWARDPRVVMLYQNDLCDAMQAIRPIEGRYERIFVSEQNDRARRWYSGEAYAIVLLTFPVQPADFHRWEKSVFYPRPTDGFHRVESFGPFVMTTRREVLARAFASDPRAATLIIARPGEISGGQRIGLVRGADGSDRFEIISVRAP